MRPLSTKLVLQKKAAKEAKSKYEIEWRICSSFGGDSPTKGVHSRRIGTLFNKSSWR
jgi:hypothetical protein